jgi:hypothetical protein
MRTRYLKCDCWSMHEDWLSQRRLWEHKRGLVISKVIMGTHMKFGYLKVFMGVQIKFVVCNLLVCSPAYGV